MLRRAVEEHPGCDGIMLGGHGLFTWGETQQECYLNSIRTIDQMGEFIDEHQQRANRPLFGGRAVGEVTGDRAAVAAAILPYLRGVVSSNRRTIAHWDSSDDALTFAASAWAEELCGLGTSCPDHFLRTRISPMFVPWDPAAGRPRRTEGADRGACGELPRGLRRLLPRRSPTRSRRQLRDSNPSVVVIPGLGLFGFAKDKREARITTEFFVNAIHVMAGANALEGATTTGTLPQAKLPEQARHFSSFHNYVALPRLEAFRIEYWALEEAKLQRMPPEREFSRKIALVVGGASGIGRDVGLQLAKRGAHVVVADLNLAAAQDAANEAASCSSTEMVLAVGVRSWQPRHHPRGDRRRGADVRRPRHRDQHRGDLSDAGAGHAAGTGVEPGDGDQRQQQPRAGAGGERDLQGAGAARHRRPHQLGERRRAEARQ